MAYKDFEKAILYDSEIFFTAKGKTFTVKPVPFKYIANGEFEKSGLCFSKDKAGGIQVLNLTDEGQRRELDKWLGRLLFYKNKPVSLKQIIRWDWSVAGDIIRLMDFIAEISGLTISKASKGEMYKDTNWFPLIAFIQSKGNMRREEILAAPLPFLNAIHKELLEIRRQETLMDINSSVAGLFGGGLTQISQSRADPRMGKTPNFKSRDDFFAFTNNLG